MSHNLNKCILGLDKSRYQVNIFLISRCQVNIFLISPQKHVVDTHLKCLALLMSTHNMFSWRNKKISMLLD